MTPTLKSPHEYGSQLLTACPASSLTAGPETGEKEITMETESGINTLGYSAHMLSSISALNMKLSIAVKAKQGNRLE